MKILFLILDSGQVVTEMVTPMSHPKLLSKLQRVLSFQY